MHDPSHVHLICMFRLTDVSSSAAAAATAICDGFVLFWCAAITTFWARGLQLCCGRTASSVRAPSDILLTACMLAGLMSAVLRDQVSQVDSVQVQLKVNHLLEPSVGRTAFAELAISVYLNLRISVV